VSEPAPEPKAEPQPEGETARIQSLESRFDRLEQMLKDALAGGGSESEPEPVDVKAETKKALRELQADEKRKADADELAARRAADARPEPVAEKPPREHRRSTRFMRWEREGDK